jgi:hypothetical protein
VPALRAALPADYARTEHPLYEHIQWTYRNDVPSLVCNGIIIGTSKNPANFEQNVRLYVTPHSRLSIRSPNLSVFDADGYLPLNLRRTELTTPDLPFEKELLGDVIRYLAIALLTIGPKAHPSSELAFKDLVTFRHPSIMRKYPGMPDIRWCPFLATSHGLIVAHPELVRQLSPDCAVIVPFYTDSREGYRPESLSYVDVVDALVGTAAAYANRCSLQSRRDSEGLISCARRREHRYAFF